MNAKQLPELVIKYLTGEISKDEQQQLDSWVQASAANQHALNVWSSNDFLKQFLKEAEESAEVVWAKLQESVFNEEKFTAGWQLPTDEDLSTKECVHPLKGLPRKTTFRKMIIYAAAIILLGLVSIVVLYLSKPTDRLHNSLMPVNGVAILTMPDGKQVILDSVKTGEYLSSGKAEFVKGNDMIDYSHYDGLPTAYSALSTSKGKQFRLVLPDESVVWLNALTTIKFPTQFDPKQRLVHVVGEAYFEIKPVFNGSQKVPFIVKANKTLIEVLGTRFNVKSYKNDGETRITLLGGSVIIKTNTASQKILPGQQGRVNDNDKLTVLREVDTDEVMAWKSNQFQFSNNTIVEIMRQVQRWYDINVIFEDAIHEEFGGGIPRDGSINNLLKILESTGKVHFVVKGQTVSVYSGKSK